MQAASASRAWEARLQLPPGRSHLQGLPVLLGELPRTCRVQERQLTAAGRGGWRGGRTVTPAQRLWAAPWRPAWVHSRALWAGKARVPADSQLSHWLSPCSTAPTCNPTPLSCLTADLCGPSHPLTPQPPCPQHLQNAWGLVSQGPCLWKPRRRQSVGVWERGPEPCPPGWRRGRGRGPPSSSTTAVRGACSSQTQPWGSMSSGSRARPFCGSQCRWLLPSGSRVCELVAGVA